MKRLGLLPAESDTLTFSELETMADGWKEQRQFLTRLFATTVWWLVRIQLPEKEQSSFTVDEVCKTFPRTD